MADATKRFAAGEVIFRIGDAADIAYFIVKGKVDIIGPNKQRLGIVTDNGIFGEMALIDPAPRMATAVASGDCECRVITAKTFRQIIDDAPPLANYLLRSLIRTQRHRVGLSREEVEGEAEAASAEVLGRQRSRHESGRIADRRTYQKGALIFKDGAPGDAVYVIESGNVAIVKTNAAGEETVLRRLGPGEVFGERAVIEKTDRTAAAIAETMTTCEVTPRDAFAQVLQKCPPILNGLIRIYIGMY
jgi:CRP-like cAMP-binding protein